MIDQTRPDGNWDVAEPDGRVPTWERVGVAVLMDIRRELRRLNDAIYCPNFVAIPRTLAAIRRNTAKPAPRKKAKR